MSLASSIHPIPAQASFASRVYAGAEMLVDVRLPSGPEVGVGSQSFRRRRVRSATLIGYSEAALGVGLDPQSMLRDVGLDLSCIDDPESFISLDAFWALLANSALKSGRSDFGIRASIARGIPNLGAVSLLMRDAESVEIALSYYSSHISLHCDDFAVYMDRSFRRPLLTVEADGRTREQSFQATQFALTSITLLVRWLIGRDFQPESVSYAFARPKGMCQSEHLFFKCPVSYAQLVSGIVLNAELLAQQPVTSQPFLRKLAISQLQPILASAPQSFSVRVDRLVRRLIECGAFDGETVSRELGIDRRTLTRRLEREGETFSSILQRIRTELACRALDGSRCSLAQVADATGFESLSSFSRWFTKSFGCSASDWRKRVRG